MTFGDTRTLVFCAAIICCQPLIAVVSAGSVTNFENSPNLAKTLPRSIFEARSLIPGADSGRSIVLWSLLLVPLGIGLILLAIITLIPIPLISTGAATGRALKNRDRAVHLAQTVMTSEECVERISCELSNFTKNYEATSWIPRRIESYLKNSRWVDKVSRGFHTTNPCKEFNCHPMRSLKKFE